MSRHKDEITISTKYNTEICWDKQELCLLTGQQNMLVENLRHKMYLFISTCNRTIVCVKIYLFTIRVKSCFPRTWTNNTENLKSMLTIWILNVFKSTLLNKFLFCTALPHFHCIAEIFNKIYFFKYYLVYSFLLVAYLSLAGIHIYCWYIRHSDLYHKYHQGIYRRERHLE